MGVLDNEGLAHFWGKVRAALAGKQDTITAGDGVSQVGSTISVTTPVRGVVTQAEFDALPEERRNKGLYVIPGGEAGGGASPSGLGGIFRHMVIFQESGTFNPADYGLKAGDLVSVTVVGGGGGGGAAKPTDFMAGVFYSSGSGGDAGKNASNNAVYGGEGGFGYGAGGGGGGMNLNQPYRPRGGFGGWSGHVVHAVITLLSGDPVPITVGAPGKGSKITDRVTGDISTLVPGTDGGTSSFGAYVSAVGGTRGGDFTVLIPGNGYARGGRPGDHNSFINKASSVVRGGLGGNNGSPGSDGETPFFYGSQNCVSGGGGGGGYIIPFSALEVETIGELVPGAGVIVVAW